MSEQRVRTLHFRARSSAGKKRGTGGNNETTQCEYKVNVDRGRTQRHGCGRRGRARKCLKQRNKVSWSTWLFFANWRIWEWTGVSKAALRIEYAWKLHKDKKPFLPFQWGTPFPWQYFAQSNCVCGQYLKLCQRRKRVLAMWVLFGLSSTF